MFGGKQPAMVANLFSELRKTPMPPVHASKEIELRYDDYLHYVCNSCDESMIVEYPGRDPVIPQIRVTCEKCGLNRTWKIYNARGHGWGA